MKTRVSLKRPVSLVGHNNHKINIMPIDQDALHQHPLITAPPTDTANAAPPRRSHGEQIPQHESHRMRQTP